MRYRRRIVRTFEFNRIFLFASAICFAVALFAVLLSVTPGAAYSAVNARVVYFAIYAQASGDDDAASKAEECQSRGGAGYLYVKDSVVYTVAAAYSTESDAAKIANTIDGGQVKAVKIGKLRISQSGKDRKTADFEIRRFGKHLRYFFVLRLYRRGRIERKRGGGGQADYERGGGTRKMPITESGRRKACRIPDGKRYRVGCGKSVCAKRGGRAGTGTVVG